MMDILYHIAATAAEDTSASGDPVSDITNAFKVEVPFLLAQIISFLVVAFVLWRYAFKPVMSTMEDRQKQIDDGLQYAEEMKQKLAEAEKTYNEKIREGTEESQRIIENSREQAQRIIDQQTKEAQTRAEEIVKQAKQSAEQERQQMLKEVHSEVGELVVNTTAKILRKELGEQERRAYAESAARELHANN